MKKKFDCYIILGPFRSGTSLIGRVIERLGADPGPNCELYEASDYNPRGYMQREDVTKFNTELIIHSGGTLALPPHPKDINPSLEALQTIKLDLSWADKLEVLFIKDPRLCITLNYWYKNKFLKHHNIKIIRITRNIKETVKSCLLHYDVKNHLINDSNIAKNAIKKYNEYSSWHCENLKMPYINILFEDILNNSPEVINNLAKFMGVKDNVKIESALSECFKGKSKIF
jgi:hypothetical protein